MIDFPSACPPPGSGGDSPAELHRQAVLVADLVHRVGEVVRLLSGGAVPASWWGPARDALQGAIDDERFRLEREVHRLDGVLIQLRYAADEALSGAAP